ncbi:ferredoxin--NADP reductase [Thiohalobacter sp.]|uniref:ferredoxin--NADP reductase n=1 Tax=Thiohalobacter sp. TaxID=2025948 RepID=UPI0026072D06|nr:ferredoxin--NADP reductase [Thiohalobacter sp.]
MADWIEATVTDRREWSPGLISLYFDAGLPAFKAGQFVRVGLDLEGERVARPYSLVNAPGERPAEILFNVVPEGPLSPRLAELAPGDRLWIGPQANGFLVLDEIPDADSLWLLATGTGLGPFLSILKTQQPWQRFGRVVLVHSTGTAAGLTHTGLLERLQAEHPDRFRWLPTLTRERRPGMLDARIPALIESGRLEAAADTPLAPDSAHVMLCGNSAMIADTTAVLEARGMKRHRRRDPGHITVEKYH